MVVCEVIGLPVGTLSEPSWSRPGLYWWTSLCPTRGVILHDPGEIVLAWL